MIKFFMRFLFCYLFICGHTIALAQTTAASLLPNGKQTFLDSNGNPLTSGSVYFYIPSTTTFKTTWQDSTKLIANANPVVLDSAGRAIIYGDGSYRQIVRDRNNNLIWDAVTSSASTTSGGGGTGDGVAVGTIVATSALVPPTNYLFAYGQEVSRTTYSDLFSAITLSQTVTCSSGSPTLTGLSDTSQIPNGAVIESTCSLVGATVIGKSSTTITMSGNSSLTTTASAVFFPYGNGNGSTTYNLPDLRGNVIAGRTNMGGTASTNLTATYFSSNPQATGGRGGSQTSTLLAANLPAYTPAGTILVSITDPGHNHNYITPASAANFTASGAGALFFSTTVQATTTSSTGITATAAFTGSAQGGTSTPYANVQPTLTLNYIIKSIADTGGGGGGTSGVTTFNGRTGVVVSATNDYSFSQLSGNIAVSQMNSGTSASSSTFWRGDGTWATAVGTGTVTSVTCGSGLAGGTITGAGTCTVATQVTNTIMGNNTGSTTIPIALTPTQVTAMLNNMVGDSGSGGTKGLVPAPASGDAAAGKFLKADGTFAIPPGGGGTGTVTSVTCGTGLTGGTFTTTGTCSLTSPVTLTLGGTNASLTASNGGIFYSTATAGAILAGTATARQMLQSGSSAAPAWSTAAWPATTTINQLLYSSSNNTVSGLGSTAGGILNASSSGVPSLTVTPVLGVAGSSTGTIGLSGITSGVVTIKPASIAGTWTATLPATAGTTGQVLATDGTGILSWSTIGGSGTVANPTGTIGLTAVNGVATSAIRSDGAPALSQSIAPTWTAKHIFSNATISATFSGPTGFGVTSPTIPMDVEAFGSVGNSGTNSTLARFYAGSVGTPVTDNVPTVAISRYETKTTDSEGAQNAALFVNSSGINSSIVGQSAQVNGIMAEGEQLAGGTGDAVGLFAVAGQAGNALSGHNYGAFAIFTSANATSGNSGSLGINTDASNNTGTNCPYSSWAAGGGTCGTFGAALQGGGSNLNTAGIVLYAPAPGQFDCGLCIPAGSVKTWIVNGSANPGATGTPIAQFLNAHGTAGDSGIIFGVGASGADAGSIVLQFVNGGNSVVVGTVTRTGTNSVAYNTTSDARLKTNIVDSKSGVDILNKIKVRDFTWKDDDKSTKYQGFIAQELYKVYPAAVHVGGDDAYTSPWQVDYGRLTPVIIKSIQQLEQKVKELEQKLARKR